MWKWPFKTKPSQFVEAAIYVLVFNVLLIWAVTSGGDPLISLAVIFATALITYVVSGMFIR